MNRTIDFYEKNAEAFSEGTLDVDFAQVQERFAALLPERGLILDMGCGSGRDTKYFLSKGFKVDAIDGSEQLCRIAAVNTGIAVRHMMFNELDENELYHGIWACASILHLPRPELADVMNRMIRALRRDGYIYTSFKYGNFEGYRNERYFTDFTESSFADFINDIPGGEIAEEWVSSDARPEKSAEKWLNLIIRRN